MDVTERAFYALRNNHVDHALDLLKQDADIAGVSHDEAYKELLIRLWWPDYRVPGWYNTVGLG